MRWNNLSGFWAAVATAVGNHLWQSTLFAAAAGLLTLFLLTNQARIRYWLWLSASMKFLIPFSLLTLLGNRLAWSHVATESNARFYVSVDKFSQPFSQLNTAASSNSNLAAYLSGLNNWVPASLVIVWFCGFVAVFFAWSMRWRRISNSIHQAISKKEGREAESLRRVERSVGLRREIPLLLSHDSREPGIFGIARPVLIWPQGISERLEDAHLESILAHELWHVRRRDNLAAAIHMAVEAIFWFHPLVWWLGNRLVEERELACDEAVLEMGSERRTYAEGILKICEFCVGSPLNCVSGVTSANLKKRIAHIMTENVTHKIGFSKKALLYAAGLTAVIAPVTFGLLNATQSQAQSEAQGTNTGTAVPAYENSSIELNKEGTEALKTGTGAIRQWLMIKPGEFTAKNASLQDLLRVAFGVKDFQIAGVPEEFNGRLFDVDAKASKSEADRIQKLDKNQIERQDQLMAQAFLGTSLHLKFHRQSNNEGSYALVVETPGKLREYQGDCPIAIDTLTPTPEPSGQPSTSCRDFMWGLGQMAGQTVTMEQLVAALSSLEKRMVVDRTNLVGKYDISLSWSPEPAEFPQGYQGPRPQINRNVPKLPVALQQQLGLRLEPETTPVEILVIDNVEMPPAKN
jgi:bla regulator protein BlaR1